MSQYSLLKDSDIPPLADGVLAVLEDVGILCENEELLAKLDQAGARVDYTNQRAKFPSQMVSEFVEGFRQESRPSAGRSASPLLHCRLSTLRLPSCTMTIPSSAAAQATSKILSI